MSGDDAPVYLESNKPEAERCVEMAATAWKLGDLSKAERMLSKSLVSRIFQFDFRSRADH